jgi:hypothetical protein
MTDKIGYVALTSTTIINLLLISMGSYMFYRSKEAIELSDFDFDGYTQLN